MQAIGMLMIVIGALGTLYNVNFVIRFITLKRKAKQSGENLDNEGHVIMGAISEHYSSMLAISVVILLAGTYITFKG